MVMFKLDDDTFFGDRVNALAAREGLTWVGDRRGEPYEPIELMHRDRRPKSARDVDSKYSGLFDHTVRFKPLGKGRRLPVLAVCSPYAVNDDAARALAEEFASLFGLACRVGDSRDVIFRHTSTFPIVFWRPDLHTIAP